jgi:HPt (histidine-containing phosphotransfer) domain-containing protein
MDDCLTKPVEPEDLSRVIQARFTPAGNPSRQATMSSHEGGPFDYEGFKQRNSSNEQLMREVASLFCEDALSYLQSIREALEARDTRTMKNKVHALKGAAANVGALGLERASREFEDSLHENGLSQALDHLHVLDREYRLFQEALTEFGIEIDTP